MTEINSLPPLISQMALTKLGAFCSERLSVDLYYLIETINLLMSYVGEERVKREYEKENGEGSFNKLKISMKKANKLIYKTKTFYDAISNKKFDKMEIKPVQKYFKKQFIQNASKIPLIQKNLFELFVFLTSITSLQKQVIKNEYFKVLEHQDFKKIDMSKKPRQ